MANSVTARFNDDCKVFVSMSDDTTVEKAVIIDAEGNETDIGGGGGSSDFSVAEVTVFNQTGVPLSFIACLALEEDGEYFTNASETVMSESALSVIMYKGTAYGSADGVVESAATTGDVSYNDGVITITGNGTITFIGGTD